MTTIAHCTTLDEAHCLQNALEGAGIPAFIPDQALASWDPTLLLVGGSVRLQVPEEQAAEARGIVEAARAQA
jgi:hypothetical protein